MGRIAVVAVAALLVLSACGGGSSSSPAADPLGPETVAGSFRCPDPESSPLPPDAGRGTLPPGATAALLCRHDNRLPWSPPRGVLTTDVGRLVDLVNEQEIHHPAADEACGGVGAPAWFMVFRYAGGIRTISGDNGGCWDLRVGLTERFGSRDVFRAYLHAMSRQRAGEQPTATLQP